MKPSRFPSRLATFVATLALGTLVTSCGTESASGPLLLPTVRESVVGLASELLDSAGRFELAVAPQTTDEITETRARELAQGWVRSVAPFVRRYLERQRRAPVDAEALRACGRAYYAESPYSIQLDAAPQWALRPYAPWWIITLCSAGGEPQVSLAVSALNKHLSLSGDQLRIETAAAGNEFVYMGIPSGWGELVVSPEDAVRELAALSGRPVAKPPRLLIRGDGPVPNLAQWELTLDAPVTGETELGRFDARTFYVSAGRTPYDAERKRGRYLISLPIVNQPASVTVRFPRSDTDWNGADWNAIQLSRGSSPSVFVPAIVSSSREP